MENLTNDTPPKKGFSTPPRTVRFPPPSAVSALNFLYKNPRQSRPEALLEGSKNFRESAFSGTFSSPHTFCTPPYHVWKVGRPLKTTFDMTTLIFSSGGCPSYPFYPLKRVPSYLFLAENPSSEGATKDHLSSKPPQQEPPGTKNQSGR